MPVALHACGDLHVRLLQLASSAGCKQLALAPCCYNRIGARALSSPVQRRPDVGIAVVRSMTLACPPAETVTAGARVRRQRDISWRGAWASITCNGNCAAATTSCPPITASARLDKPFADATAGNWRHSKGYPQAGRIGWRWRRTVGGGWPRSGTWNWCVVCFGARWKLWLVLDRALFLRENGYRVEVGSFCD